MLTGRGGLIYLSGHSDEPLRKTGSSNERARWQGAFRFRAAPVAAVLGWTIREIVFERQSVLLHRLHRLSCVPVPKWHNRRFCQVVGMPCVRSPIFLRVKALHPHQRRLRCPRRPSLAYSPPKNPASRPWPTSAPGSARRTRRCATC